MNESYLIYNSLTYKSDLVRLLNLVDRQIQFEEPRSGGRTQLHEGSSHLM